MGSVGHAVLAYGVLLVGSIISLRSFVVVRK